MPELTEAEKARFLKLIVENWKAYDEAFPWVSDGVWWKPWTWGSGHRVPPVGFKDDRREKKGL